MAAKLLGSRRVVAYLPSFREAVRQFRAFSSYDERWPRSQQEDLASGAHTDPKGKGDDVLIMTKNTVWPDPNLGALGPQDLRFSMPGLVGPSPQLAPPAGQEKTGAATQLPDILATPSRTATQLAMLQGCVELSQNEVTEESMCDVEPSVAVPSSMLECIAQECPRLVKQGFQDLFPNRNIVDSPLTVITISHRTKNDMSGWSSAVEEEREELLDHFVSGATDICTALKEAGYWADFIDPASGKPYLGENTNSTLYETDERLKGFGFDIDDLGCCKVIRHHIWGTHAYVGCLFTNAPVDHPVLEAMHVQQTKK